MQCLGLKEEQMFKRTTNGTFVLFRFHEGHTHLLATPRNNHMLNSNRRVNRRIELYSSHSVVLILVLLKPIVL